eukprot:992439-Rhodomonas_salina.1
MNKGLTWTQTFEGIEAFPERFAVGMCEQLQPEHPDLPSMQRRDAQKSTAQAFTEHFTQDSDLSLCVRVFQTWTISFAIEGNKGALRVRTHQLFQNKPTESAVCILNAQ